jgi:hypothetical protein
MSDQRLCANCRAPLPAGAAWCEACGTDAGAVFDGRISRKRPPSSWLSIVVVLIALAAAVWFTKPWWTRYVGNRGIVSTSEPRVVKQRPGGARRAPGATLNEPEAMMRLRKSTGLKDECVAVISRGFDANIYTFDAVDRCRNEKLGRFTVDAKTGTVKRP